MDYNIELKKNFITYLKYDDDIRDLNKKINKMRKVKNESEKNILDIMKIIEFNKKKIRYNDEIMMLHYEDSKVGLSKKLLISSLESYFSKDNWKKLSKDDIIKSILDEIEKNKELLSKDKETNLKIKRVK